MNCIRLLSRQNHDIRMEICRKLSMAQNKLTFTLKNEAESAFENGIKHRHHPGVRHNPCAELPYKLQISAQTILNKYRGKRFLDDVERVWREFYEIFVTQKDDYVVFSKSRHAKKDDDYDEHLEKNKNENKDIIRSRFELKEAYNAKDCVAYMAARMPANYAALSYIFNEIKCEEPQFEPSTLFDFGSGIGTTIWTADQHWKDFKEIFCVDLNENMNELSRELLQKGTTHQDHILDRVFYRQFLPVKHNPQYDLVVSAFSLLDFYDTRSRLYIVENLWKKTSGMLVLVEHGSKAGFTAIMEARNFILQISNKQSNSSAISERTHISTEVLKPEGSVVAPCPHDLICPRVSALAAKSFCNFKTAYHTFDYGQKDRGIKSEKFTYVVLKKDKLATWSEGQKTWPRIVQPVIQKSKHHICRLCTSQGQLNEVIVSKKKFEVNLYRTSKNSKWGDKLPVDVVEKISEN